MAPRPAHGDAGRSGAPTSNEPRLLTLEQVAETLQVSRWFIYDHGAELGLVKVGRANRYLRERVEQYVISGVASPPVDPALVAVTSASPRQRSPRKPARRVPLLDPATALRPRSGGSRAA